MDKLPTVSIVVPTYNQSKYLGACLDSIMFQDYSGLEVVIVYDDSPDDTERVIEEFLSSVRDERVSYASSLNPSTGDIERTYHHRYPQGGRQIKVIHNPERRGSTFAYNIGFKAATGTFCTYVASDDLCHPQMISELAAPLIADAADFAYSDMFIVDDDLRILREFKLPDFSFEACFLNWYLCGVSKLYRRDLHDMYGWYDENYIANDHEFYQRIALAGARFTHVPKTLYSVRSHDQPRRLRHMDVHSPSSWERLLNESRTLVQEARKAWSQRSVKCNPKQSF